MPAAPDDTRPPFNGLSLGVSLGALIVGVVMLLMKVSGGEGILIAILVVMPMALGPLLVNALLGCRRQGGWGYGLLTVSSVAYFIWYAWIYRQVFYVHTGPADAQASVALLFVGIYSLPVMLPVWIVVEVLWNRWRDQRHRECAGPTAPDKRSAARPPP